MNSISQSNCYAEEREREADRTTRSSALSPVRWRKAVWSCRPLFCFCPMGKARGCFNSASPVPTGELPCRGPVTWKLSPCRLAAAPPRFTGAMMAPFHSPPPLPSRSPPGHRSPAWGFGSQGWAGGGRNERWVLGAGSTRQLEKCAPWGTEQPAASRAQMDPRRDPVGSLLPALPLQALGQV